MVGYNNEVPFEGGIKEDSKFEDVVKDPAERDFIVKLTDEELHKVVVLANFMNIKRLLELCCVRLAWFYRCNILRYPLSK